MSRLEQLHKLHAADPNDPFCTYGIALEIAKTGDVDDALTWLDKTLALDATYHYAYYQKGQLLADADRETEALDVLKAGLASARAAKDDHAASEITTLIDTIGG